MTTIVTRAGKGSALTWTEADANFSNLNDYKVEQHAPAAYCKYGYVGVTTPIKWSNTLQTVYGYAAGANGETTLVNNSGSQTLLGHGVYFGSDYNYKYAAAATTPAYISMSGGQVVIGVCASSGTPGTTATFNTPLKVIGSDQSVRVNEEIIGAVNGLGFRNALINGDMRVYQRGGTTTVNSTASTYSIDQWYGGGENADGVFTITQGTASPPTGFVNYLRVAVTTADASIGAGQGYLLGQVVEGLNFSHLGFGTSWAKQVTLSFWTRSSLTGTFSGSIRQGSGTRSYPFSYTISSANTWEYKTVTLNGDTSGSWPTDTSRAAIVTFDLGSGSSYRTTANAWTAGNYIGVTGAASLMSTLNATLDFTGVQLEAGPVASPFERVEYGEQLRRCQRYYARLYVMFYGYAPDIAGDSNRVWFKLPTSMRIAPTVTKGGTWTYIACNDAGVGVTAATTESFSVSVGRLSGTGAGMAGFGADNLAVAVCSAEL